MESDGMSLLGELLGELCSLPSFPHRPTAVGVTSGNTWCFDGLFEKASSPLALKNTIVYMEPCRGKCYNPDLLPPPNRHLLPLGLTTEASRDGRGQHFTSGLFGCKKDGQRVSFSLIWKVAWQSWRHAVILERSLRLENLSVVK